MYKRYIDQLPLTHPQLGTWPATQACALTGNQSGDLLVPRLAHNPLSHTSQGSSPTILNDSLAGYSRLGCRSLFFITEYFVPFFSSLKSFCWEVSRQCYGSSPVGNCFSHAALKSFSLSLTFAILIMMCLGMGFFGFILFWIHWGSWTCVSFSFTRLWMFLVIISSNRISVLCSLLSFWYSYNANVVMLDVAPEVT